IGLAWLDERMRARGDDVVPAHMRDLDRGIAAFDTAHGAADPAEAGMRAELLACVREQLHADANAEERPALVEHRLAHRIDHAGNRLQRLDAGAESADAR